MGIENAKEQFEEMRRALDGEQSKKGEGRATERYVSPEGTSAEIEQKITEQKLQRASNTSDAEALKEIDERIEELRAELEKTNT